MPQIARIDSTGTLISVDEVAVDEWITDRETKTVQLPDAHDMADKIGDYHYDYDIGCFMPILGSEDNFDKVIDALTATLLQLSEHTEFVLSPEIAGVLKDWRRLAR